MIKIALLLVQFVLFGVLLAVILGWQQVPVPANVLLVALFACSLACQTYLWSRGYWRYRSFQELLHRQMTRFSPDDPAAREQLEAYAEMLFTAARTTIDRTERYECLDRAFGLVREHHLDQGMIFAQPRRKLRRYVKRNAYELLTWDGGREVLAYVLSGKQPERFAYPQGHVRAVAGGDPLA